MGSIIREVRKNRCARPPLKLFSSIGPFIVDVTAFLYRKLECDDGNRNETLVLVFDFSTFPNERTSHEIHMFLSIIETRNISIYVFIIFIVIGNIIIHVYLVTKNIFGS